MNFKIEDLIERLQGTCNSPDGEIEDLSNGEHDDLLALPMEELQKLDEAILRCDHCGWWCESHTMQGDGEAICADCYEDEE